VTLHPVLAHSWGWDEAVYFAIPIIGALFWVRWIEKRAKARKEAAAQEAADTVPAEDASK
jgi:hypothetical protein